MAKLCYVEGEYRDALGNPHSLWSASMLILFLNYDGMPLCSLLFVNDLVFQSGLRVKEGCNIRKECPKFKDKELY